MQSISVVIPTIGKSNNLLNSINNFLDKSLDEINIELIIIFDINQDSIDKIFLDEVKKLTVFAKNKNSFSFKKFNTNKSQSGPGFARNIGIDNSSNEYIHFCDDDDFLYPENYKFIEHLKCKEDVILMGFSDSSKIMNNKILFEDTKLFSRKKQKEFFNLIENKNFSPIQSQQFLFRKDFLKKNNIYFPITHLIEDIIFNLISLYLAKDFILINKKLYLYNNQLNSTKSLHNKEQAFDHLLGLDFLLKNLSDKLGKAIPPKIINESISRLILMMSIRLDDCKNNLIEAKDFIFQEKSTLLYKQKTLDKCKIWLSEMNKNLLQQIIEKDREKIDFYKYLWNELKDNIYDENDQIYIICFGPLGKSIFNNLKNIYKNLSVLDDRWEEIKEDDSNSLKNNIFPISYLNNLNGNNRYIFIIANPNLSIENNIFCRINQLIKTNENAESFRVIKGYSTLIGIE